MSRSTRVLKTPPAEKLSRSAMPTKTTDLFDVEHLKRSVSRENTVAAATYNAIHRDITLW